MVSVLLLMMTNVFLGASACSNILLQPGERLEPWVPVSESIRCPKTKLCEYNMIVSPVMRKINMYDIQLFHFQWGTEQGMTGQRLVCIAVLNISRNLYVNIIYFGA